MNWKILDRYLLLKPSIRSVIEWSILIVIGAVGTLFSAPTIPFSPLTNMAGAVVFLAGGIIHRQAHIFHRKAHEAVEEIDRLVTAGIYSKIRHPCYLSLILMYFGVAILWGIAWILIPAAVFTVLTVLTALREERLLLEKFGSEYREYTRRVRWRFIPKVF
jgi:protein-S-isoprenylcysteine O-methyltransferase Ste14